MRCFKKEFSSREDFKKNIRGIRHFLYECCCPREGIVFVAINEAVNNALFHGNKGDASQKVFFSMMCDEKKLVITVKDQGGRLGRKVFMRHLDTIDPMESHGRGLMIIDRCCQRLLFPEPGMLQMNIDLD